MDRPSLICPFMAAILLDNAAGHKILVNAYASTTGSGIPAALNSAHTGSFEILAGRTASRPVRANRGPGCFRFLPPRLSPR